MLVGSVEAGGTKFVCAIGDDNYNIVDRRYFITGEPRETISKIVNYLKKFDVRAIGIASFGPLELKKNNEKFGYIINSPKLEWRNVNIFKMFKKEMKIPIYLTTDVNGAAYGEYVMSQLSGKTLSSLVYYTIGTGVGAGVIYHDSFLGDLSHPEMGHVKVKRHDEDASFKGVCPYHHDCLEGLISGPTFEARLGKKGKEVSLANPVWNIMAYYMAQALIQTTLILRPGKIVIGGGVTNYQFLCKVRTQFMHQLNRYIDVPPLDKYISLPRIKNNGSATIGNFALALKLLSEKVDK